MHRTPLPPAPLVVRAAVTARVAGVAFAALAVGCGGGGGGDPAAKALANDLGGGLRISKMIGPADWEELDDQMSASCATPPDRNVYVSGVTIVAIDSFDETGEGQVGNFYVEDTSDDPLPYSGVTVFTPSFSPPALRLAQGDTADLLGVFEEFPGPADSEFSYCRTLPEVGGTMSFRFDGRSPNPAKTIPLVDLKAYATARQYLGMLVRVEGVTLATAGKNKDGRYNAQIAVGGGIEAADVPQLSNELYDLEAEGPSLPEGQTFSAVTGIITYFYGFKLAPRSPADFEP